MQILIGITINIVLLAIILPLFYIYIVSKARERLERETVSKAREEIEALVREFNNIALERISLLEDAITRASKLSEEIKENKSDKKETEYNFNNKEAIGEYGEEKIAKKNLYINIDKDTNIVGENTTIKRENNGEIENKKYILEKTIPRGESIERLKNKLDMAIRKNIYNESGIQKETPDKESNNESIIKLHKEGFSKEQIAKKLNCAITEIDIVMDMEGIESAEKN